jgi:hypothetical protein
MKRAMVVSSVLLASLFATATGCSKESAAAGRAGTRLALSKPADQTMTQGESNKISVSVDRTGFADPVQITFSNLPQGVRVNEETIAAGDSSRNFVLIAAPDAAVVNKHIVTVEARGAGIQTSQTFELTVKARN